MKSLLKSAVTVSLSASLLGTHTSYVAFAEDVAPPVVLTPPIWTPGMTDDSGQLVPPPLFNQDGTPFQNREQYTTNIPQRTTNWFPGMRDSSGKEIPAPLYNPDGTPYVEGVSPRPEIPVYRSSDVAEGSQTIEKLLTQTIDWFPGMLDRNGNAIPAPLFNSDGSTYVEGESPRPKIPVYADVAAPKNPVVPPVLRDQALAKKVNTEIKSTDISLRKSSNEYVLEFEESISAIDSSLYLFAVNKKSKRRPKLQYQLILWGKPLRSQKLI
jgi:hypothetical protein